MTEYKPRHFKNLNFNNLNTLSNKEPALTTARTTDDESTGRLFQKRNNINIDQYQSNGSNKVLTYNSSNLNMNINAPIKQDIDHSLSLINFKMNFDILQNKIAKLNSLISSGNVVNFAKDKKSNINIMKINSVNLNANSVNQNPDYSGTINLRTHASFNKIDLKLNETKDKINSYLSKHSNQNIYTKHTSFPKNNYQKFKSFNVQRKTQYPSINILNYPLTSRNNERKPIHFNMTTSSATDLFSESVHQFCITPRSPRKINNFNRRRSSELRENRDRSLSINISRLADNIVAFRETYSLSPRGERSHLINNLRASNFTTLFDRDNSRRAIPSHSHRDSLVLEGNEFPFNSRSRRKMLLNANEEQINSSIETQINRRSRNNTPSIEKMTNISMSKLPQKNKPKLFLNLNSLQNSNNINFTGGNNTSRSKKSEMEILIPTSNRSNRSNRSIGSRNFNNGIGPFLGVIHNDIFPEKENEVLGNNLESGDNINNHIQDHIVEESYDEDRDASLIINEIIKNSKNDNKDDVQIDHQPEIENLKKKEKENKDKGNNDEVKSDGKKQDDEISKSITLHVDEDYKPVITIIPTECAYSDKKRVSFSENQVVISYIDGEIIQDLYLVDDKGRVTKNKKRHFLQCFLRSKKKPKSIIKKGNRIHECDEENSERVSVSHSRSPSKFKIIGRNKQLVQKIENARKKGEKLRKKRKPTPRKPKKVECCHKFKKNPDKFFTETLCDVMIKSLNINQDKGSNLSNNGGSYGIESMSINSFNNDTLADDPKSPKNTSSKKYLKNLKNIISNIQINESPAKASKRVNYEYSSSSDRKQSL